MGVRLDHLGPSVQCKTRYETVDTISPVHMYRVLQMLVGLVQWSEHWKLKPGQLTVYSFVTCSYLHISNLKAISLFISVAYLVVIEMLGFTHGITETHQFQMLVKYLSPWAIIFKTTSMQ